MAFKESPLMEPTGKRDTGGSLLDNFGRCFGKEWWKQMGTVNESKDGIGHGQWLGLSEVCWSKPGI